MAKHDPDLDRLFHALADPTRRAIVERLLSGPASVSDLAAPTGTARPTVTKHIAVLEETGLLRTGKAGRTRICRAIPAPPDHARGRIEDQRRLREARLDRLDDCVTRPMEVRAWIATPGLTRASPGGSRCRAALSGNAGPTRDFFVPRPLRVTACDISAVRPEAGPNRPGGPR